ncbi:hypothetical protein ABZW96_36370 [Nocardia sp. NPDC004168]|uniref:hypothetical protein n=1 Tax=Nocardia sp. NPDC004168 TaxID=3154452 RepID=UPI0033A3F88A
MPTSKKRVKKQQSRSRQSRKHIERFAAEAISAASRSPAHVPVWMFRQRAAELAVEPPPPGAEPLPANLWLQLLAATPIRIRSNDGAEVVSSVVAMADRRGLTVDEVIDDLSRGHLAGELSWSPEHEAHIIPATLDDIRQAFTPLD